MPSAVVSPISAVSLRATKVKYTAVAHILGAPPATMVELNMRTRNSSLTEFAYTPKRHLLLAFNQLPHLDHPDRRGWETYA